MKTLKLNRANAYKANETIYVVADNINYWFKSKICTDEIIKKIKTEIGIVEVYEKLPATAVAMRDGSTIFVKENPEEIERMLVGE